MYQYPCWAEKFTNESTNQIIPKVTFSPKEKFDPQNKTSHRSHLKHSLVSHAEYKPLQY
jgi:hypothetical protein